ncbi:hypothetical protein PUN28_016813 [Cardiocondyla obscurior]|uniref:Uncharacterized protein n=1 Tax=Cardiocondyla obscurior TaxID=286306 RepID=A0AAW2ESM6_9HYME
MQYSAALGSRLWGRVGHRHQKKSPTWPEPPTVKLAPLSINRCASDRSLLLAQLVSVPLHPLFSTFSLRPLRFYYFFPSLPFPLSSFFFSIALNIAHWTSKALMQSLSKLWYIAELWMRLIFPLAFISPRIALPRVYQRLQRRRGSG